MQIGLTNRQAIQRGRHLEYLTLGWNLMEGAVAIGAGVLAGSTALLGFGIDSLIESLSGTVLLWRLTHGERGEQREQRARKLVGISLLVLAVYVAFEALESLVRKESPAQALWYRAGCVVGDRDALVGSGQAKGGGSPE